MKFMINTDLFGNVVQPELPVKNSSGAFNVNPCIKGHGHGPEGTRCKTCAYFERKHVRGKVYFKCELRGDTNGTGTDHRANWPTCGRYQQEIKTENNEQ